MCRASTDARQAVSLLEIGFVSQNEAGGFVERGGDWDKEIIKWLRLCKFHYCAFREGREVKEFVIFEVGFVGEDAFELLRLRKDDT